MMLLDTLLRVPSITFCVLLIVYLGRDARQFRQAWIAIALLFTVIASSVHTMPSNIGLPESIYVVALFIAVPGAALQWWFSRSILQDNFRPGYLDWSIMIAACLFKLGWSLQGIGITPPAHTFRYFGSYTLNILTTIWIIWIAWSGLKTDLVEHRRRVRYWFVFFLSLTGGTNLVMELAGFPPQFEAIFIHATILPLLFLAVIWLSGLMPEKLFFDKNEEHYPQQAQVPERMGAAFNKLQRFMEADQGYTDHDLTIGKLAQQIGLPEHQLRRLINQSLGYRNFATYLNFYRLDHAKAALRDPANSQIPILTLAMDAGYKTLSTFNRAFKTSEDETPSDFRKRALRTQLENIRKSEKS